MKLTQERYDFIMNVIRDNPNVKTRLKALRAAKKRFVLKEVPLGYRSTKIGYVHHYTRSVRVQFGCPKGYMRYAWVVMFEPMDYEKAHEFNIQRFGRLI